DARRSHRAGKIGTLWLAIFRWPGQIRTRRYRPYWWRGQPAQQTQIPVLDRRQAKRRKRGNLDEISRRASRLLVARLARFAQSGGSPNRTRVTNWTRES